MVAVNEKLASLTDASPVPEEEQATPSRTLVAAVEGFTAGLVLTPAQRRFIQERILHYTDADCARSQGLNPATIRVWKCESQDFALALERQRQFSYAPYVVGMAEDGIGALFRTIYAGLADADGRVRMKAAELLARILDVYQPRGKSTSDPETTAAIKAFTAMVERVGRANQPLEAAPAAIEGQIVAPGPVSAPSEASGTGEKPP